jgi:histone H3/H4
MDKKPKSTGVKKASDKLVAKNNKPQKKQSHDRGMSDYLSNLGKSSKPSQKSKVFPDILADLSSASGHSSSAKLSQRSKKSLTFSVKESQVSFKPNPNEKTPKQKPKPKSKPVSKEASQIIEKNSPKKKSAKPRTDRREKSDKNEKMSKNRADLSKIVEKKKTHEAPNKHNFKNGVYKLMKCINPDGRIANSAVDTLDDFIHDIIRTWGKELRDLMMKDPKRKLVMQRDVEFAIKMTTPNP